MDNTALEGTIQDHLCVVLHQFAQVSFQPSPRG